MTPTLPAWLEPVREAAATITADDLSRYVPPEDSDARDGAVLMLFGAVSYTHLTLPTILLV